MGSTLPSKSLLVPAYTDIELLVLPILEALDAGGAKLDAVLTLVAALSSGPAPAACSRARCSARPRRLSLCARRQLRAHVLSTGLRVVRG